MSLNDPEGPHGLAPDPLAPSLSHLSSSHKLPSRSQRPPARASSQPPPASGSCPSWPLQLTWSMRVTGKDRHQRSKHTNRCHCKPERHQDRRGQPPWEKTARANGLEIRETGEGFRRKMAVELPVKETLDFSGRPVVKTQCSQCKRPGFDPLSGN